MRSQLLSPSERSLVGCVVRYLFETAVELAWAASADVCVPLARVHTNGPTDTSYDHIVDTSRSRCHVNRRGQRSMWAQYLVDWAVICVTGRTEPADDQLDTAHSHILWSRSRSGVRARTTDSRSDLIARSVRVDV